jgi:predicted phage-related endonuclease
MGRKESTMLENSVFIDGQQGKTLDGLFKSYNELGTQINDLTTSRKKVADEIKSICNQPVLYETVGYTIRMKSLPTIKTSINKELLKEKYPDIYNEVLIVETIEPTVQMGTPKKK